jgi:hypothetical protein
MKKKSKVAQIASTPEGQEDSAERRKAEGLARYQSTYTGRDGDFSIDERFTEEQIAEMKAEIGNGSITPKTLKSRKFFSNGESRAADETDKKVASLVSRIDESTSRVHGEIEKEIENIRTAASDDSRFEGFGQKATDFEAKITSLQSYEVELRQFQGFLTSNPTIALVCEDFYANDASNSVVRFGINAVSINTANAPLLGIEIAKPQDTKSNASTQSAASSTQYKKDLIGSALKEKDQAQEQKKMLHPLEVSVIEKAIKHFNSGCTTVLIDIFNRDNQNAVKFKDGNPDVHTVVLRKQSSPVDDATNGNIIVIIDPSNSTFSRHLASDIDHRILRV